MAAYVKENSKHVRWQHCMSCTYARPNTWKNCNQFGAARSEALRKITFGTPRRFGIHFKMTILRSRATISTYDLKENFISWQSQAKKTQEQPEASSYVLSLRMASNCNNPGPTAVFGFACPHAQMVTVWSGTMDVDEERTTTFANFWKENI